MQFVFVKYLRGLTKPWWCSFLPCFPVYGCPITVPMDSSCAVLYDCVILQWSVPGYFVVTVIIAWWTGPSESGPIEPVITLSSVLLSSRTHRLGLDCGAAVSRKLSLSFSSWARHCSQDVMWGLCSWPRPILSCSTRREEYHGGFPRCHHNGPIPGST